MYYHNITYPDMNNGDGLRVALWLSGCSHHCYNCQNLQTWNPDSGILFDKSAEEELFRELNKDYISGMTLTGGDPLYKANLDRVLNLVNEFRLLFPQKTIWLYTGFQWKDIFGDNYWNEKLEYDRMDIKDHGMYSSPNMLRRLIISQCDVLVDGRYIDAQRDVSLQWRGSSNQMVIDIQQSLKQNKIILWC